MLWHVFEQGGEATKWTFSTKARHLGQSSLSMPGMDYTGTCCTPALNAKAWTKFDVFLFSPCRYASLFCTVLFCKSLVYQLILSLCLSFIFLCEQMLNCMKSFFQVMVHVSFHLCLIMG